MYWTGKSGETLRVRRYHRSKTIVSQHIIALPDIIAVISEIHEHTAFFIDLTSLAKRISQEAFSIETFL